MVHPSSVFGAPDHAVVSFGAVTTVEIVTLPVVDVINFVIISIFNK